MRVEAKVKGLIDLGRGRELAKIGIGPRGVFEYADVSPREDEVKQDDLVVVIGEEVHEGAREFGRLTISSSPARRKERQRLTPSPVQ
ncbi:MAG: hypothetical protein IPL89_16890 [Acidobacteria bacterium]|nr:hypothetical protein [Acidobacteriota bacterium]